MRRLVGRTALGLAALVLVLAAAGCLEGLFAPEIPATGLVVSQPSQMSDETWVVLVSATEMPAAVSGILIDAGGVVTENVDRGSIAASGMSGFIVTAQQFDDASPLGQLVAVHPSAGIADGKLLRFTFAATGTAPRLTLDETRITLSDDQNAVLEEW